MTSTPVRYTDRELVTQKVEYSSARTGGGFQNLIMKGNGSTPSASTKSESPEIDSEASKKPTSTPPAAGSNEIRTQPVEQDAVKIDIKIRKNTRRREEADREESEPRKAKRAEQDSRKERIDDSSKRRDRDSDETKEVKAQNDNRGNKRLNRRA